MINALKRGFTLIELLVVMTIIALLAGMLTPVVIEAIKQAEIVDCTSNLKNLGIGLEQYKNMSSRRRAYPQATGPVFPSARASRKPGLKFIESLYMGKAPIFTEGDLLSCASNSIDYPNKYELGSGPGQYSFDKP